MMSLAGLLATTWPSEQSRSSGDQKSVTLVAGVPGVGMDGSTADQSGHPVRLLQLGASLNCFLPRRIFIFQVVNGRVKRIRVFVKPQ